MKIVMIEFTAVMLEHNHCPTVNDSLGLLKEQQLKFSINDELGIGSVLLLGTGDRIDFSEVFANTYTQFLAEKLNFKANSMHIAIIKHAVNKLLTKKSHEFVFAYHPFDEGQHTVRADILNDLYEAIDEFSQQIADGKELRFGNVMQLRDELEAGKRYSEILGEEASPQMLKALENLRRT